MTHQHLHLLCAFTYYGGVGRRTLAIRRTRRLRAALDDTMRPTAAALIAIALAGATLTAAQSRDYRLQNLDVLNLLEKPWLGLSTQNRWDRPRIEQDLDNIYPRMIRQRQDDEEAKTYNDDVMRVGSEKRSAVATALNAGRRRRQPTPALGKAVTPYVGVGVLNDVGSFFDSLRDNLETLASLSPQQRSNLFQEPPTVVHATSSGGGGGGGGIRRLHALRPLRPTGNIRSDLEAYGSYPGANHHDPGLLWTGLGR
ncbi:uncharacterized protein LOC125068962 [Vanessa atalanta]|uniref:uncharacterized protein LOC125068962 n=1 Tax=Vanessa atalanta TaxID=42275 RepID=UPI001FCE1879|nr:uncharacterized protein LOC125068962 [Vanessa atalanta]